MSTATYKEAHVSHYEYFGIVSSMGSEVRQVVIYLISFGFLPAGRAGLKRALRRSASVRFLKVCLKHHLSLLVLKL